MLLGDLHGRIVMTLRGAPVDDPQAVAGIVLSAHGIERVDVLAAPRRPVAPGTVRAVLAVVERIVEGVPPYRAIGRRPFHGLDLEIGPATLEPRDDTETLVEAVLDRLGPGPAQIADLGTGTGAVALALLWERPQWTAVATDIDGEALAVARRNAARHGVADRITFAQGSWLAPLGEARFDAIVSNPPYIASSTIEGLDPSVRDHDPRAALDGGSDGLDAYRAILADTPDHLVPRGFVALEIGFDQREALTALAGQFGFAVAECRRDLAGLDRVVVLQLPVHGTK